MTRPLVVAHRGGAGLAPENTLAACRLALGLGVDAVEVDVRLAADGVPVVLHDPTLDRTTSGRGPLSVQRAAALRALDATIGGRGRFPAELLPLLAEVLALLRGRAAAHIELKGEPRVAPELVEAVVDLLDECGEPAPLLLSFDWDALAHAHARAPNLALKALAPHWPASGTMALERLSAAGVGWLGLGYAALTPVRLAMVRAMGLRLGIWTVNHVASLRRGLRLGVDALTTDRPDRLLPLLASAPASA